MDPIASSLPIDLSLPDLSLICKSIVTVITLDRYTINRGFVLPTEPIGLCQVLLAVQVIYATVQSSWFFVPYCFCMVVLVPITYRAVFWLIFGFGSSCVFSDSKGGSGMLSGKVHLGTLK